MKRSTRLLIGSFKSVSALLIGIALLQAASGLQGTLIGLRAAVENFSTPMIGLFMSLYYAGFLAGAHYAPKIIQKIGHPRMFAAMASVASITIFFHYLTLDPYVWAVARAVNGFAFVGMFVTAESWLNDRARPRVRGQVVSVYMMIQYLFLAMGYNLVNAAEPSEAFLYILTSILISAALLPVLLTTKRTPHFQAPELFPPKQLFQSSPLSAMGAVNMGLTQSIMFTMGVIYLQKLGLPTSGITLLLTVFILSGALSQWPFGALSDKYDRRYVIGGLSLGSAAAMIGVGFSAGVNFTAAAVFIGLYGAFFLPLYAMILAYMNDRLKPQQMVSASGTLYIFYGVASVAGPLLCAGVMSVTGNIGFAVTLFILHLLMGIYTGWRIKSGDAVPDAEQGSYIPAMRAPIGVTPLLETMLETAQENMEMPPPKPQNKKRKKRKKRQLNKTRPVRKTKTKPAAKAKKTKKTPPRKK